MAVARRWWIYICIRSRRIFSGQKEIYYDLSFTNYFWFDRKKDVFVGTILTFYILRLFSDDKEKILGFTGQSSSEPQQKWFRSSLGKLRIGS